MERSRINGYVYPFKSTSGAVITQVASIVILGNKFQNVTEIAVHNTYILKEHIGVLFVRSGIHHYCLERWRVIQ